MLEKAQALEDLKMLSSKNSYKQEKREARKIVAQVKRDISQYKSIRKQMTKAAKKGQTSVILDYELNYVLQKIFERQGFRIFRCTISW